MFIRSLIALSIAAGLSCCATPFSPNDVCSLSAPTLDSREVQCRFPKTAFARKFKFTANFSGGHDDTKARIETFIDNTPMTCDEGSKTNLFAEDGDVQLWCTFSIADHPHTDGVFTTRIRWHHAEYTNYVITPVGP